MKMLGIMALDEMNIEELKKHREVLENEEYDNECDYEFTRLEISEINKLIEVRIIDDLVRAGFSHSRMYQRTTWNYITKMMDIACKLGYAKPFDFGRGKGKYITDLEIKEVSKLMQYNEDAIEIAKKYIKYREKK